MYARPRPRKLSGTQTIAVQPFDRVDFWKHLDKFGRPPLAVGTDGEWISLVHGVNVDGSFMTGKDPLTGKYWPGDAQLGGPGGRVVYYNDLGPVPFMDPDGFQGWKKDFDQGFGGGSSGSVYIAPPVALPGQTVSKTPPPAVVSDTTTVTDASGNQVTTANRTSATSRSTSSSSRTWWLIGGIAAALILT